MEILFLIILGIVQGLTEFLPVSSSGHLVLLSNWFGITDSLFVSIILHIATLLSIVVALRKDVFSLARHPFSSDAMKLYFATIPTCIIVLVLMPFINDAFAGASLWICFMISAVVLLCADLLSKKKKAGKDISYKQAFIIGIAQGFASMPGISRSGSTISAGLLAGADKEKVAKFSFMMSIPIIILSLFMEVYKIIALGQVVQVNVIGLILSFIFAFVVGVLSIKIMLKLTQKANFRWFALYLILISILTIVL